MKLNIQARGFALSAAIKEYVQRRLNYVLSNKDEVIQSIHVRLSDINGPKKGGADKRCSVEVRLHHLPTVVVEDTQTDLYAAVDHAAVRTGRTVERKLQRQREFRKTLVPTGDPDVLPA